VTPRTVPTVRAVAPGAKAAYQAGESRSPRRSIRFGDGKAEHRGVTVVLSGMVSTSGGAAVKAGKLNVLRTSGGRTWQSHADKWSLTTLRPVSIAPEPRR
jgi:hypothetical protein